MVDLLEAIKTAVEADATLGAAYDTVLVIEGAGDADDRTEPCRPPYCRIEYATEQAPTDAFGSRYLDQQVVRVSLFHPTLASLQSHYLALRSLLDGKRAAGSLTLSGTNYFTGSRRVGQRIDNQHTQRVDRYGRKVYRAFVSLATGVDRSF